MSGIKDYLLSITIAAIICSILLQLTNSKTGAGKVIRLLTGIMMSVTVLRPLVNLDLRRFTLYPAELMQSADSIALVGTEMADEAMDAIIIAETQAYILDKATSLGADLEVEVLLSEHIPKYVRLRGAISPGAKARLTAWIQDDLNIPPEAQKWN